jgi:hypothetical protein
MKVLQRVRAAAAAAAGEDIILLQREMAAAVQRRLALAVFLAVLVEQRHQVLVGPAAAQLFTHLVPAAVVALLQLVLLQLDLVELEVYTVAAAEVVGVQTTVLIVARAAQELTALLLCMFTKFARVE